MQASYRIAVFEKKMVKTENHVGMERFTIRKCFFIDEKQISDGFDFNSRRLKSVFAHYTGMVIKGI